MRPIDAILDAVRANPALTAVEKALLIERIERLPLVDELQRARDSSYPDDFGKAWVNIVTP
jgi:hypothetical protein